MAKLSQYKRGKTHQFPGDYSRQAKALVREGHNIITAGGYILTRNAMKRLKREEEFIINRKVRRDRSYLNEE